MSKKLKLGVDIDGVLADYNLELKIWAADQWPELGVDIDKHIHKWYKDGKGYPGIHTQFVTKGNGFKELSAIQQAPFYMNKLYKKHYIHIITSRLHPDHPSSTVSDTIKWLDEHSIKYHAITFLDGKGNKADIDCDLYVDDSPKVIKRLKEADKNYIFFANEYSSPHFNFKHKATSWIDLYDQIDSISKSL